MKRKALAAGVLLTLFMCIVTNVQAQGMMGGRCPMCGRNWNGMYEGDISIPESLPEPRNQKWIESLQDVLSLEELSRRQYERDQEMFNVSMPYMMVIPQENNHIQWIRQLLAAYGIDSDVRVFPVEEAKSVVHAYKYARQLESDLIPRYESLIRNAEDDTAGEVLNVILLQTRMHYTMFDHALNMGMMRGGGMR